MIVHIGSDHRGFTLKESLKKYLSDNGHTVTDWGAITYVLDDDYPVYGKAVANAVAKDTTSMGIVICGSGGGISIAANKVPGIRAVLAHDETLARAVRNDDDANVLALGADSISAEHAHDIVAAFLNTPFSADARHVRRINEIETIHGE
ncbi:MAG: Ribose 5-phosphate isomerase [Candidatus Kaiserbacteria bacterium]|nr:Ribose 5-phosphate isomerase [Candidatus Kaiserbacteria bacterium]